ncbi:DUF368 domain-containing protein [Ornithobacterium rhinotracheale]|uniref:DUF368 domain-containing protein n=1 Tax=Ornithobacterium rhinotracheale TaxID=28251 RepID=UPI00129C330E|nr:DUF368 domain-containing protein [Ornithobacterium rhinotracheale]MRJ07829.1 DUF368 domain-containing protein [Ornithobacterium rhinotracheale]MRJ10910.1 DUF368 domain-containing protein [Ornithobacterium rhinotracheale]UOH78656.1 DUF368 domain-containing protein [Ornithobacterium rhinotracheale]
MRNFKDYLFIYLKGIAMGSADVVPGVSGGTIAFISGIYDELIQSISNIKPALFKDILKGNFKEVWQKVNGNFLVVLLAGIATSILSLAKLITFLLQYYPIQLWSFFFGLIVASIFYVGKQVKKWNLGSILGIILGTIAIFYVSTTPPLAAQSGYLYLFLSGALAACAMILPGISGSFILLLLGAYTTIISAIGNHEIGTILVVVLGAGVGLLSFSKLLNYLLENHHNTLVGVLTGFLIGSLWKIWPWKINDTVYTKEHGEKLMSELSPNYKSLSVYLQNQPSESFSKINSLIESNVSPNIYSLANSGAENHLISAILFGVVGFLIIFIIEYIAKSKNV